MHCDDAKLNRLLDAADTEEVDQETTAHLSDCVRCQTRLRQMAGEDPWWAEASHVLGEAEDAERFEPQIESSIIVALDSSLASDLPAACEPLSLDFLSAPSHPEMLGRLGRYEIERVIGSGGMGVVLKGFDTELHRPVAIKVLAPHLAGNGAARARFARESQAAAAIVHEHVLPIHNVESNGQLPYLVMPFVAGRSLQARLDDQGPLDIKDIVRIALQTAQGLAAAHAQGIVHRDVKPGNILLEDDVDRVRISDFGLARAADDASVTRTGILTGTPQYMSPEQTRGEAIDHRSDLFSLGSVIYAMCTGRPPFRAETTMGVLRRISDDAPRPLREINSDVPWWLETIVSRLLAKSPADRYHSAGEVAQLLEQCLGHLQHPTSIPLPASVQLSILPERPAWKRALLASAIVAAIGLIGVFGFSPLAEWLQPESSTSNKPDTEQTTTEPEAVIPNSMLQWHDGIERELTDLQQHTGELEADVESLLTEPTWNPVEGQTQPIEDVGETRNE